MSSWCMRYKIMNEYIMMIMNINSYWQQINSGSMITFGN